MAASNRSSHASADSAWRSPESTPLQPYVLSCDREPLNSRLGPADFYPPSCDDPELKLTRETVTVGYKEEIANIDESREVLYSLVSAQALWTKQSIQRCRSVLRARFKAFTSALARRRKVGQVFGVPLTGLLLARPGAHPELKGPPLSEDWLADLASTKPLHHLADSAPQGLHGAPLIDALLRARAPLVRATWLVKACYLGQVRPLQISGLSGGVQDKSQGKRTDLWTRDLLAYLDSILAELEGGGDKLGSKPPTAEKSFGGEKKWQQLMPLLLAHYAEGLINAATTVDWALRHFADVSNPPRKVELLLPVVLALLEGLLQAHTQAHLQQLTKGALAWLERLNPSGGVPDKLAPGGGVALKLAELVRYIHMSAPDSFVGAGALPIPECVLRCESEEGEKLLAQVQEKVIRKRASLAAAVNPVVLRNNEARAVTALDSALLRGDIDAACAVFDDPLVGGEGELTAVVTLVCNWAVCTHDNELGKLRNKKPPLLGGLEKHDPPESGRNETFSLEKPLLKEPSLVGEAERAKEAQKVASDFLATSRVYFAVSVLRRFSQNRVHFAPFECHVALCEWLATWAAGADKLLEIMLAQLADKGLLDRVRFARELVADGKLSQRSGARVRTHSWREILKQLPGGKEHDVFVMEKRAALAVAGSRKRKQEESTAEGGLESIWRCISSLLDLPIQGKEGAVSQAVKRQKTEKEERSRVDWWWLKGKETVTQLGETAMKNDEVESESAEASETKELEERQTSTSWRDFEMRVAGLSYPQKEKVASWLLTSTGLDRRRLKEVGWEEDVRWQKQSEQQDRGRMEIEEEQRIEKEKGQQAEESVSLSATKRLLCTVYMLDILGQHEMLVDLLLGLLTRASSLEATQEEESFAKASGRRREDSFNIQSLLAVLQRYAPLIAGMDLLPQLLSVLAKRVSGESECLKDLGVFVSDLRSEYGSLSCFMEWEKSARQALGPLWAEVDRAVANKKATRVPLGREFETIRTASRSVLERELGGAAQLARLLEKVAGEKGEIEKLAKAAGMKLAQQGKGGPESIAAGIAALIDIAADIETEGDSYKQHRLLDFCSAFVLPFGSGLERRRVSEGVVLALERVVQEQAKKATSQPAPFHKMSPETPDLGSTTLPDIHETEDARAVLALALSAVLISQGSLDLKHFLDVLQLEAAFKEGNVAVTRASLQWFRVLFSGATSGDEIDSTIGALIEGPCAFFVARDQAKLPLETVYAVTSSLLRLTQNSHFEAEAKRALLEALPILKARLLADTASLYELVQADTCQQEAAVKVDELQLATWQEAAAELLPLKGTCLLRLLSEGTVEETNDFRSVEELEAGIVEALLESLECIHTGNFHWRALEVRLLLAEQVTLEKHRGGSSARDALASVRSQGALSESEKAFTTAVLTRLLTRPDAAPLYSQLAQILGKDFSDYLIQQVRWALEGSDMLQGRKSLRQLLEASAARDGFRIGPERAGARAPGLFALERALGELVLPCLAGSSSEVCAGFAAELVKQLAALEASVGARARARAPDAPPRARSDTPAWGRGPESSPRGGGGQWGSAASSAQTPPASAAALQTSIWLRLQFVLPMLPQIHADRDPSPRNMRLTFAPVLLRLLASPVIYHASSLPPPKDAQASTSKNGDPPFKQASTFHKDMHASTPQRDAYAGAAAAAAATSAGESLFDRLMAVLHALMSSTWQEWLKPLPGKGPPKVLRDVGPFDRVTAERMQAELDALRPNLPASVFQRLQSALPILLPRRCTMPSIAPVKSSAKGTSFLSEGGDSTMEFDPWLLLEEGATGGHVPSSHVAPKAAPWLKGAIRVPRKELTYGPKEEEEELE